MKNCGLVDLLYDREFFGDALDFANREIGKAKLQFAQLQAIEILKPFLNSQPQVKEKLKNVPHGVVRDAVIEGFATLIVMYGVHLRNLKFWE